MLRNLAVRTKLVAMVAVPMAVLGLVTASGVQSRSATDRNAYLLLSVAGIALTLLVVSVMARSVTAPLARLTDAAETLSRDRLPGLVDSLRNPTDDDHRWLAATVQPIEVRSHDELGRLAEALNAVQSVAVDVAAQQSALLRKGISDLFVNLARRNQALIDRQIALIDRLEAGEEDPDVLEELFRLDHLATRMRRNAESLLVLAGIESTRRRAEPVPLLDTIRSAISEVEDYARVEIVTLEDATVAGAAVVDVAHLIAELMDNATQFSSPETAVSVSGRRSGGSYQISVTDRGLGMTDEQLADANALLAEPPVVGLAISRTLGFVVTARIATRHGISVRLDRSLDGGITALVTLPRSVLADRAPDAAADRVLPPAERVERAGVFLPPPPDPMPSTLAEALPSGQAFDRGLAALLEHDVEPGLVEPPVDLVDPPARPEPPAPDVTRSGLARRIRKAPAERPDTPDRSTAPASRTPDEVRALLARYRSGLDAGRTAPLTDPDGPA